MFLWIFYKIIYCLEYKQTGIYIHNVLNQLKPQKSGIKYKDKQSQRT